MMCVIHTSCHCSTCSVIYSAHALSAEQRQARPGGHCLQPYVLGLDLMLTSNSDRVIVGKCSALKGLDDWVKEVNGMWSSCWLFVHQGLLASA